MSNTPDQPAGPEDALGGGSTGTPAGPSSWRPTTPPAAQPSSWQASPAPAPQPPAWQPPPAPSWPAAAPQAPSPQAPYQQAPYQQAPYQQAPYQQGPGYGQPPQAAPQPWATPSAPLATPGAGSPPAGGWPVAPAAAARSTAPFTLGEALSYAWTKFGQNAGTWLVLGLITIGVGFLSQLLATGVAAGAMLGSVGAGSGQVYSGGLLAGGIAYVVLSLVGALVGLLLCVGLLRAGLDVTRGRPISVSSVYRGDNLGQFVLLQVLLVVVGGIAGGVLGAIPGLGVLLAVLVGLALGAIGLYAGLFVLDRGLSALDAVKAGYALVRANPSTTLVVVVAVGVLGFVGAVVFVVGALVTVPLAVLLSAFAYRKLIGDEVAA